MSLVDLANEILLSIAENLAWESDINALARTNRRFYILLNLYLYQRNVHRSRSSALRWAAEHGRDLTIQTSLDAKADVRATRRNRDKSTALHLASVNGHLQIAALLTTSGACIDAQNSHGFTPLHLAILHRFEPVARMLIEKGAEFRKDWPGRHRQTALHVASYFGLTPIVQLLLEKGADVEARDVQLRTPLHWAVKIDRAWARRSGSNCDVWKGDLGTVRLLLEKRANPRAQDKSGKTPQSLGKMHPDMFLRMMFKSGSTVALYEAELHDRELQKRQRLRKEHELVEERDRLRKAARDTVEKERIAIETAAAREKSRQDKGRQRAKARLEKAERSAREKQDLTAREQDRRETRRKAEAIQSQKDAKTATEQRKRAEKERQAAISREKRQDVIRRDWAAMKERAERRSSK